MKQNQVQQKAIRLGTHGEDYGSWMSNPVFYAAGTLLALSAVLALLSFAVFHITALGIVFVITTLLLLILLGWITWIRRHDGADPPDCPFPSGFRRERAASGRGMRLRTSVHPGGPHLAIGPGGGY